MKVPYKEISILACLAFLVATLDRYCECMRKITFDLFAIFKGWFYTQDDRGREGQPLL